MDIGRGKVGYNQLEARTASRGWSATGRSVLENLINEFI